MTSLTSCPGGHVAIEASLARQQADELGHEEGVAPGAAVDGGDQALVDLDAEAVL